MKKLICILTVLSCLTMLAACESDDDDSPKKSKSKAVSSQSQTSDIKLSDVVNWATGDIWNKGFCDIYHYVEDGKGSTGQQLDIEFTVENLKIAYEKKEEYNDYIHSLDGSISEQAQLINAWDKMCGEMDALYTKATNETPKAADPSYEFNTDLFKQYFDVFYSLGTKIKEPIFK